MVTPYKPKPPRNRIAISTKALARRWRERLNKTTEEMGAAVEKLAPTPRLSKRTKGVLCEMSGHDPNPTSASVQRALRL
jgi:hypothetical protein